MQSQHNMAGVSEMIERNGQCTVRWFGRPTDLVFRIHRIAWELRCTRQQFTVYPLFLLPPRLVHLREDASESPQP